MATQGPTPTPYDASTFTNVKAWAGSVQGTNKALTSFGWLQTSDANQIDWTNATVAPFASNAYPNTVTSTNATAGGPIPPYVVNARGVWAGNLSLTSVATASGGTTVYTGTITGGGSNAFAGFTFTVTGFTTTSNNGTFVCSASTTTTLTLINTGGVSETHAATASATYNYLDLVRSSTTGGGTGNDYLLTRSPFPVTAVQITTNVATITAANNLSAGETVRFQCREASFLNSGTYTVLASGLSATQFQVNVAPPNVPGQYATSTNTAVTETTGSATSGWSYAFIVVTSTTRPETDTKNYIPYYYEMWKTNDSDTYSETAQNVSYSTTTGLLTLTLGAATRLKAGFNITISGATNVPQINGTWSVNSVTTTQLVIVIPNTMSGFTGNISATDTYTITYTLYPIYMKLEYYNNTGATNAPFIRVAFGTGTDGVGNLVGNRIASDTAAPSGRASYGFNASTLTTTSSMPFVDLVLSQTANTSSIWRCIWSGSTNQFGAVLFYNRNDTNAAQGNGGTAVWIVERARDNTGNAIDDYFTMLFGGGNTGSVALTTNNSVCQRSILKPNPFVNVKQVTVDASNNVTVNFTTNQGFTFPIGAIVYVQDAITANFLNGQFLRVIGGLKLTSVANASAGSTVYTGTISGGNNNFYSGATFVISGFTNGVNNGTFTCTASTATTLTLSNAAGVSETHAGMAQNSLLFTAVIASGHANYGPALDTGVVIQSTSLTTFTPIAGTGFVGYNDNQIATIRTSLTQNTTITVNGNTPLLPIFPQPGYCGNPMTMAQTSILNSGGNTHDTTFTVTMYGATRTYYNMNGLNSAQPLNWFGQAQSGQGLLYLRFD